MTFAVGSLVAARGREWVVLPESVDDFLVLRPLGGTEEEVAGVFPSLENVKPAQFAPPDPSSLGDFRSCRLLRDAVRLGFRSSAGPFRCFGSIAVEPRPYQLVPLLMALKLDPVRLLIADDVGIGKTIEAGLVASELISRGEADRLAVLCPPALAEQWQRELREKFHLEAELVLPSTVSRLERGCGPGVSLFERHPYVIVSMDFIKSESRRLDFLRACPDLVIVDEAHTCAAPAESRGADRRERPSVYRGGSHQRHALVRGLAEKPGRHLVLVTATPHSGKEEAFRSILGLLDRSFLDLPHDLSGEANRPNRARLAAHLVQRRRGDIRHYLNAETDFPERKDRELSYDLSADYRSLFERVLAYARETVQGEEKGTRRERIRWWSAIALLRSLASSPAAAAATLRKRAETADAERDADVAQLDELGARAALDLTEDEGVEGLDVAPGAAPGEEGSAGDTGRRRLLEFARLAEGLRGEKDAKLHAAAKVLKQLLAEGYNPIVFCRFIPTAGYVAEELRGLLPKGVEIAAVTGELPPEERELRIDALATKAAEGKKVLLVATDCLSEGVNLQHTWSAVFHYDLSWNPTRHEQREGRVDRYLQKSPEVRVVTFFGRDNRIDGIVLDVLLRKHKKIRSDLGISVSVPGEAEDVMKAVFEGLFLRGRADAGVQGVFEEFEEFFKPTQQKLHGEWQAAADREKRSRTLFAQETIKTAEVEAEMKAAQAAVGSGADAARFVREALAAHRAVIRQEADPLVAEFSESPQALRESLNEALRAKGTAQNLLRARFDGRSAKDVVLLTRTHPVVQALGSWVLDTALDPKAGGVARRCGALRTNAVARRTTLLLVRFRFHVVTEKGRDERRELLAEEAALLAFAGAPASADWLDPAAAEALLDAAPTGNLDPGLARDAVHKVVADLAALDPFLTIAARDRAAVLHAAHERVREASRSRVKTREVAPQPPVDVLGVYVFLPEARA